MQAWVEVPDEWGWGPVRILRGRLEDDGYHTEEYRLARGIMIQVTAAGPPRWPTRPSGKVSEPEPTRE